MFLDDLKPRRIVCFDAKVIERVKLDCTFFVALCYYSILQENNNSRTHDFFLGKILYIPHLSTLKDIRR